MRPEPQRGVEGAKAEMRPASRGRTGLQHWIEANVDRLYGYAFSLTRNAEEARDLVQECFLKALESARRPDEPAAYRAWFFRILRNAWIDRLRKQGRELPIDDMDHFPAENENGWSGDKKIVDIIMVRIAMAKLPVAQREIITLVDFVGCSYAEAAAVLQVAEGTVMSRLSRARRALLDLVAEDTKVTPIARGSRTRRG